MNDLSLHIIDVIQNSLSAGASIIKLTIGEKVSQNLLFIEIVDNGKGMTQEQVDSLDNPFFTSRTTRRVGMGIPLFRDSAIQSGGALVVTSQVGKGTTVTATFELDNIDCPPLGDIGNSFILMVSANPNIEFLFRYVFEENEYLFDTVEIKEVLDGLPINEPSVIRTLTSMVNTNIEELKVDGNNEDL